MLINIINMRGIINRMMYDNYFTKKNKHIILLLPITKYRILYLILLLITKKIKHNTINTSNY